VTPPALFDTHAHLHFPEFAEDLPAVLERARAVGVAGLVTIGTDVPTSVAAIELAGREADVWAAVGIHPHDAAIGEIGLDFLRNLSPPDIQARTFRSLLEVAARVAKPVLVHCRDAHDETLAILAEARLDGAGGIMHCFSGDVAIARRCLDLGLTISLAGPVTYPNARALPEVARFVPSDRLVVETDCPFLPPQGHRGRRNEPAYLALTAARVAELRGEPLASLGPIMRDNARRLFGLA